MATRTAAMALLLLTAPALVCHGEGTPSGGRRGPQPPARNPVPSAPQLSE